MSLADLHKKEISDSIQRSIHNLEEREKIRRRLALFNGDAMGTNAPGLARELASIETFEDAAIQETVHIIDKVQKLYAALKMNVKDVKRIEKSRQHKVAANYVNTKKHGYSARRGLVSVADFSTALFFKVSSDPKPSDPIIDVVREINFEGEVVPLTPLVVRLLKEWIQFLGNLVDLKSLVDRLDALTLSHPTHGRTVPMPESVIREAKRLAAERRSLS